MKQLKIVVIGGASTYTPELINQIIKKSEELEIRSVTLVDLESNIERLMMIDGLAKRMFKKHNLEIEVESTTNRKEALKDADFVVLQIRVGKQDLRFYDETIPFNYDMIGHETLGIGGMFSALRTVPVVYEIIEDIKEIAPNAWTLCISNPIGIISEAVFRFSEYDRFIGICTDPVRMHQELADSLGVAKQDLIPYIGGLNELSFAVKVYHNHRNKMAELLKSKKLYERIPMREVDLKIIESYPNPSLIYLIQYEEILNQRKVLEARSKEVKLIEEKLFNIYKDESLNERPKELDLRDGANYAEEVMNIMTSIVLNKKTYHVVNTVNRGHITDIREECAIEITSRLTNRGPLPVHIGELPQAVKGLVQHQKAYEELLCDAIYEKNLNKALMAIKLHPMTKSSIKAELAFKHLLKLNEPYLKYYGAEINEII